MAAKKTRKKAAKSVRGARKAKSAKAAPKKVARKASKKTAKRKARKSVSPSVKFKFKSLTQVRAAIDAIDEVIVPLLCRRLFFVTQAAQFKPSVKGVVILPRVEEVVDNARRLAKQYDGDPDTMEIVYRTLIDAFTVQEQNQWRTLHARR